MRLSTEQGERSHYLDMCQQMQDPLMQLFKWQWRLIRHRIRALPQEVQQQFKDFVYEKLHQEVQEPAEQADFEQAQEDMHEQAAQPLENVTVVLIGRLRKTHEQYQNIITTHGGQVWKKRTPRFTCATPSLCNCNITSRM